jgi:HAD superfamily hydrolase (TIGR01490 family)
MSAKYIVFFDVDETLIQCKTMLNFLKFFYRKNSLCSFVGYLKYSLFKFASYVYVKLKDDREFLNKRYYKCYTGITMKHLIEISQEWFLLLLEKEFLFNEKVVSELRWHQKNNAEIVFVSGSFPPCLNPIASYFNVHHVLSIQLEEKDGKITGNIIPPQTIGEGKATAIKNFLQKFPHVASNDCFAYGDHSSDLSMLKAVGHAVVVGNNKLLLGYAKANNWKTIN